MTIELPQDKHSGLPDPTADPMGYVDQVILREAKEENDLVPKLRYTMLSAYTNNPLNQVVNAPSGEGKNYVVRKVASLFPQKDLMFIAGMTPKALFHSDGELVVKNEFGGYDPIEPTIKQLDQSIKDLQFEIASEQNQNNRKSLQLQLRSVEEEKQNIRKDARKRIDLSHKILIFLDTPNAELFNAIMPLLSHDNYEVEYGYVDDKLKTKINVLVGWPAVIFCQALDFSHYKRYPEIRRRFIISTPKMNKEKYKAAVELMKKRFGLPDILYQLEVVSKEQKETAKSIIKTVSDKIRGICDVVEEHWANNVIIPFDIKLPGEKALDMTNAYNLFSYLSLLPMVNDRPRLVLRKEGQTMNQIIPIATLDDLKEAQELVKDTTAGVNPYLLRWYNEVFLPTYKARTEPDSRVKKSRKGEDYTIAEERVAVTTNELVEATTKKFVKKVTGDNITHTYLEPLINNELIDKAPSQLDGRQNIYYPCIDVESENGPKFDNSTIVQDENSFVEYIKKTLEKCCNIESVKVCELQDSKGAAITIDEVASVILRSNPIRQFDNSTSVQNEREMNKEDNTPRREDVESPQNSTIRHSYKPGFGCWCGIWFESGEDFQQHINEKHIP